MSSRVLTGIVEVIDMNVFDLVYRRKSLLLTAPAAQGRWRSGTTHPCMCIVIQTVLPVFQEREERDEVCPSDAIDHWFRADIVNAEVRIDN